MLYLARVNRVANSETVELELLAHQREDGTWLVGAMQILPLDREIAYGNGVLLLVELGITGEIERLQSAKDWILGVIEKYLSADAITPEFVRREEERIEQWRQEITVGSLELTRRNLEIETRRDQLQELEAALKLERETLDQRAAQGQEKHKDNSPSES
jgi:Na+/phosphate symporter